MLNKEEAQILHYLRQNRTCSINQITRICLPGSPADWTQRVLENLEWFGYVTVFPGINGTPAAVQITPRGKQAV